MSDTDSFTSLAEWLAWLETLSPREIVLGLDRVQTMLHRLALRRPATVVHIGGTNGKGSCAAMLESLFLEGGIRTGCYTSPHIHRYNERIRLDGKPASDSEILSALRLIDVARGDLPLTFFEFGTLVALVTFDAANVGAWILEVGLGGRLDAVNAINPDISLITNVSLDHCAWLGDDRQSIAREKAGIMRSSKPTVFGSTDVPDAIRTAATDVGAQLKIAGANFEFEKNQQEWTWRGDRVEVQGLHALSLPGDVQLQNAAAVLAVVEGLGFHTLLKANLINAAFSTISLEGRFQVVMRRCPWIVDVAHNPAAANALVDRLGRMPIDGNVIAILGILRDKDVLGVIEPLRYLVDRWIAVSVASARSVSATQLAQQIAGYCERPCLIAKNIDHALDSADRQVGEYDAVIVTGSFLVVGPALKWLARTAQCSG